MHSSPTSFARRVAVLVLAGVLAGCSQQTDEERGREAMKEMEKSTVDVEAIALAQPASAEVVSEVQRNLTAIHEYQGEINGKIDSVTVNAIQSFQRTAGVKDDGIITAATREKLAAAASQQPS
ncbi:MAG: peptidoglycan-binding domain-containing protein [Candidatus Binatia bacterium]